MTLIFEINDKIKLYKDTQSTNHKKKIVTKVT